jgi:hypothetical protein
MAGEFTLNDEFLPRCNDFGKILILWVDDLEILWYSVIDSVQTEIFGFPSANLNQQFF